MELVFKEALAKKACTRSVTKDAVRYAFQDVGNIDADISAVFGLARTQADLNASGRDAPPSWAAASDAAKEGGKTGVCSWFRQFTFSKKRSVSAAAAGGGAAIAAATYSKDFFLNVIALEPAAERDHLSAHNAAVCTGNRPVTFVFRPKNKQLSISFGVRQYHKTVNAPSFWLKST